MIKKPMLASTLENVDSINYSLGLIVSPKLDGIRCLIINGVAMSRSLKPIRNEYVQFLFGRSGYNGLDGELVVGDPCSKTCYRDTNSGVMSQDGMPEVRFHVFDRFDVSGGFRNRYAQLPITEGVLIRVPHHVITTKQQLLDLEEMYLKMGYEGLMLRHPEGPYKENRSTPKEGFLMKLKRFTDRDAEVIGTEELLHNANEAKKNALGHTERSAHKENLVGMNTLGALLVRDTVTGVEFSIGTGFTQSDREELWANRTALVGQFVKYKSFDIGVKDKPRFPVWLGMRNKEDI